MKHVWLFLLLSLSLILSSCGAKKGKQKTKAELGFFVANLVDTYALFPGGIMVYGQSDSGKTFAFKATAQNSSVSLPRGFWTFWAIGWEGSALIGPTRCGKAAADLSAPQASVNMTLSAAECAAHNEVAPASFITGTDFKLLRLVNCQSLASVVDATSNCSGVVGTIGSYKIALYQYNTNVGSAYTSGHTPLTSSCITDAAAGTGITDTSLNIPVGGTRDDFLVTGVQTFSDASCSTPLHEFVFPRGIYGDNLGLHSGILYSGTTYSTLFLEYSSGGVAVASNNGLTFVSNVQDVSSANFQMRVTVGKSVAAQTATSANFKFPTGAGGSSDKNRTLTSNNFRFEIGN